MPVYKENNAKFTSTETTKKKFAPSLTDETLVNNNMKASNYNNNVTTTTSRFDPALSGASVAEILGSRKVKDPSLYFQTESKSNYAPGMREKYLQNSRVPEPIQ